MATNKIYEAIAKGAGDALQKNGRIVTQHWKGGLAVAAIFLAVYGGKKVYNKLKNKWYKRGRADQAAVDATILENQQARHDEVIQGKDEVIKGKDEVIEMKDKVIKTQDEIIEILKDKTQS